MPYNPYKSKKKQIYKSKNMKLPITSKPNYILAIFSQYYQEL